jgi:hypothetical protein
VSNSTDDASRRNNDCTPARTRVTGCCCRCVRNSSLTSTREALAAAWAGRLAHPLRRQRPDIAWRHPVTDKLRLSARCFLVRAKQDAEIAVIPGNASRCRNIEVLSPIVGGVGNLESRIGGAGILRTRPMPGGRSSRQASILALIRLRQAHRSESTAKRQAHGGGLAVVLRGVFAPIFRNLRPRPGVAA